MRPRYSLKIDSLFGNLVILHHFWVPCLSQKLDSEYFERGNHVTWMTNFKYLASFCRMHRREILLDDHFLHIIRKGHYIGSLGYESYLTESKSEGRLFSLKQPFSIRSGDGVHRPGGTQ
jgi:hypothetical protein